MKSKLPFVFLFLLTSLASFFTTFFPPLPPVPYGVYSSNTQLSIVLEHAMLRAISEPLHMTSSLLGIPSPACPSGKPTPCHHVTEEMLFLCKTFFDSDTFQVFFSFVTVPLTQWAYSTVIVCRFNSSLACNSLEITDWDLSSLYPSHPAWGLAHSRHSKIVFSKNKHWANFFMPSTVLKCYLILCL